MEDVAVANGWRRDQAKAQAKEAEQKVYKEEFAKMRNPADYAEIRREKREKQNKMRKMVLPYPGEETAGQIRRTAKNYNVIPIFKKQNTIESNLVCLKDRIEDDDKKDCVYEIPLKCGKKYIGETKRLYKTRKNEHKDSINKREINKSAIFEHLVDCQNTCGMESPQVLWDQARVLTQETHGGKRLARESLEIKLTKGQYVNRNRGQPEINEEWMKVPTFRGHHRTAQRGRPGQKRRRETQERRRRSRTET